MAEDALRALESAAKLAAEKGLTRYSRFLDPAQLEAARRIAARSGAGFDGWGGYEGAERAVACFFPEGEPPRRADFPIVCLRSAYAERFCSLSHRDLLGAFMALGLTRACIGDMILGDGFVYLFAEARTAPFIAESLTQAGKASLRFEALSEVPPMPEPKGSAFRAVVSSLRLDAVLAAAYRLSRSEAAEAVRAGLVKLDHVPCDRADAPVRPGAMLSLRGGGRVKVAKVEGETRKGRIGVTLFRYE